MYIDTPIGKYLDDLAARLPAPGGGSAAALGGALGAALLEMVCSFTLVEDDVKRCADSLKKIRVEFSELIDKDVEAYTAIRSAFKTKDKKIIDKALKDGYYISLKICELSSQAARIALTLSEKGNPNLITDVGCGVEFLNAAFNSGIFNAEINLKGIEDKNFTSKEKSALEKLKQEMDKVRKDAIIKTKKRME